MEELKGEGRGKIEFDKRKQKVPKGRDWNEMKLIGVTVKIEFEIRKQKVVKFKKEMKWNK